MSYEVLITTPGLPVWDHDAAEGVTLGLFGRERGTGLRKQSLNDPHLIYLIPYC